ncbi:MAG: tetratricopeptide repeat protein [Muribaculaceae bacterium]|nr:tetratricopeptide repeat protein [Muribaculaceae bacterium]
MKAIRSFFIGLAAAIAAISIWAKTPAPLGPAAERARALAKARYTYIEAANAFADDRYDDYYMLLRRASALNPDDPFIAGEIADMDLLSPLTDTIRARRSYEALRQRFLAAPSDLYLAGLFVRAARNAGNLDDLARAWAILDSLRPERADVSLNLAEVLVMKSLRGDSAAFPRALAIYDRLLSGLPGDIGITSQKIRAYSARRDTASIIRELNRLVASAPDNTDVNLYAGNTYGAYSMADSAMKYFDHALELDPESGRVFISRAQYFEQTADTAAFDHEVFNALAASDLEFDPKLELLLHYVRGLFEQPENRPRIDAMFEKMLEINPGEARLHALYGAYEETQDNIPAALEQYSYSIDLDPSESDVWMSYLRTLSLLDKEEPLLENSRRAARLFPDNLTYSLAAASLLLRQEKRDEALALLDSVPQSALADPKQASSFYSTRGDILYNIGLRDSAYAEYTRAISADPRNAMAMNNVAYFMALDSINLSLARTYASLAVSEEPENPTFLDTYAWVEFRRRDFAEAKRLIDLALKAYEPVVEAIDTLALDSVELAHIEEALEEIEVVEAEEPSADIYDHAGDIYFWNGLLREAAQFWEKAAMLKPEDELIAKKAKHKTYFAE